MTRKNLQLERARGGAAIQKSIEMGSHRITREHRPTNSSSSGQKSREILLFFVLLFSNLVLSLKESKRRSGCITANTECTQPFWKFGVRVVTAFLYHSFWMTTGLGGREASLLLKSFLAVIQKQKSDYIRQGDKTERTTKQSEVDRGSMHFTTGNQHLRSGVIQRKNIRRQMHSGAHRGFERWSFPTAPQAA